MKGILLAAGHGRRLANHLQGMPKFRLTLKGEPLLLHQARNFLRLGVRELAIVVRPEHAALANNILSKENAIPKFFLVHSQSETGFGSFQLGSKRLGATRYFLGMIDSVLVDKELGEFRTYCTGHHGDFVVGCTDYIDDEKPTYVVLDDDGRVIDVGRQCGPSSYVTAGYYLCPANFSIQSSFAADQGVNSLSDYLGFYTRHHGPGYPFVFHNMIDVDTIQDLRLAEKQLDSNEGIREE